MARMITTADGIGELLDDGRARLVKSTFRDLGEALAAGWTLHELAGLPTRAESTMRELRLRPPVVQPPKIWAQGLAYRSHALEVGAKLPEMPRVFLVAPSALIAHGETIRLPPYADGEVDYEGEMAIVIGRRACRVPERDGWSVVAGVTVANDVSARDIQKGRRNGVVDAQMANTSLGKSLDTFKPLGPALATLDAFDDPDDIALRTYVDGELRQEGRTSDLIFSVPEIVAFLSARTQLEPGDLILTGTPGGVGHPSGRFLHDGSTVRIEIDGVGALENGVAGAAAVL